VKVRVTPRVVAGTDRGGEDLFLDLEAHHDGDTPPVDEPVEVLLRTADDWEGLTEVREPAEFEELVLSGELPDEKFHSGVRVYYRSCHYDFEWEGTGEDALAAKFRDYSDNQVVVRKVEDVFRNSANWAFCHKPGESPRLRCYLEHYVNGNAE
jgi:hypothetical protein